MRSNVCRIENGTQDLEAILNEAERVAEYNGLDRQQTLHLSLLCEELDGMLAGLAGEFGGKFWIDLEDGVCKINASIEILHLTSERREQLIAVSKSKKNASASGVIGKIRSVLEDMLLNSAAAYSVGDGGVQVMSVQYLDVSAYQRCWSLRQYKSADTQEAYDELESSVIAAVADDVIVGIKGSCASVVIIKNFK